MYTNLMLTDVRWLWQLMIILWCSLMFIDFPCECGNVLNYHLFGDENQAVAHLLSGVSGSWPICRSRKALGIPAPHDGTPVKTARLRPKKQLQYIQYIQYIHYLTKVLEFMMRFMKCLSLGDRGGTYLCSKLDGWMVEECFVPMMMNYYPVWWPTN
jgi:hypothetical protein